VAERMEAMQPIHCLCGEHLARKAGSSFSVQVVSVRRNDACVVDRAMLGAEFFYYR
jgi:hypothetical protein